MSKYIEAEKLKLKVSHEMDMQDTYLPAHFFDIVDDMPAADVAEIVRCKECKHREYGNYSKEYYCEYDAVVPYERKRNAKDSEWFCADGAKTE